VVCGGIAGLALFGDPSSAPLMNSDTELSEAHPDGRAPPRDEHIEYGGMIMLTGSDSGGAFGMEVGRAFAVRLPEDRMSGYLWTLSVPAGITEDSESSEPSPKDQEVVGPGGSRTWTMHAEQPGRYLITAAYRRAGEETPADSFSVIIDVA
jgi:predicted secreted protein